MNSIERALLNLIIARLDGNRIGERCYREYLEKLVEEGIGGFIVFGGNFVEIKDLIKILQSLSNKPLIIASDIERGVGQQIEGATLIPSQMGIAAGFDLDSETDRIELVKIYSIVIAEALKVGINLALIPVLDVNTEAENPIICTRAFSDNVDTVSNYGKFLIEIFESAGLPTCAKHFPGHGPTRVDSHFELPEIRENIEPHLEPFRTAIKNNVSSIMVGHLLLSNLDKKPSSLSEKIVSGLLRKELLFKGVVLSDAMNMKALRDFENPYEMALNAGVDIILHPQDPYEALDKIKKAFERGTLEDRRIIDATRRIQKLREKISINSTREKECFDEIPEINLVEIFKKTVTVIKNQKFQLNPQKISVFMAGNYSEKVYEIFRKNFKEVFSLENFNKTQNLPLIAVFTETGFGKRNSITEEEKRLIKRVLREGKSILVSFGNPYVLRPFKEAKTIVAVYDSNEIAVQAFIEVFNSGLETKAKLPIELKWTDD